MHAQPRPAGDDAGLAIFNEHRSLLFAIAYRMLGSVTDAEDMLQETFIRWQERSQAQVDNPRAYLVTIVSRLCINHLQSARVKREAYVGHWLPEPVITEQQDDPLGTLRLDESLSMALLVLLERLSPTERAVFILHEVFDYKYSEIASALGQSESNCRQIFHRAREHVGGMRQRFQASARDHMALLERFVAASRNGDMSGLLQMLSAGVTLHSDGGGKAVAVPNIIRGANKVARGVTRALGHILPKDLVYRLTWINGDAGVVTYRNGEPFSTLVLDVRNSLIHAIYVVTNPDKLSHLSGYAPFTARAPSWRLVLL
jgi:RNA polymerase sigma-70 factor (ECF subfamily)